jgi:hypothetical protein
VKNYRLRWSVDPENSQGSINALPQLGLTVIDLRFVCSSTEDYANPIEPSSRGGAKIARCILAAVEQTGKSARVIIR